MNVDILTGDRPSGSLHLGHYVGSLEKRVALQNTYTQFIMIADVQALTDNYHQPDVVQQNVYKVLLDYISVGIDPTKTTIFIQSLIPQLPELMQYYLNLVTVNRLQRNPTVKTEIKQKNFGESIPAGFLMYPVSQAADITAFKARMVPVGQDQLPVIEQTVEIVRTFNRLYQCSVLVEPQAITGKVSRLVGIDGKAKMSKSLNNAIFLNESMESVAQKVRRMYTDPLHINIADKGRIEGNTVFTYLDAFAQDKQKVEELKTHYQHGGLADSIVKKYLLEVLEEFLCPIHQRYKEWKDHKDALGHILKQGSDLAQSVACHTLKEVKSAMQLTY